MVDKHPGHDILYAEDTMQDSKISPVSLRTRWILLLVGGIPAIVAFVTAHFHAQLGVPAALLAWAHTVGGSFILSYTVANVFWGTLERKILFGACGVILVPVVLNVMHRSPAWTLYASLGLTLPYLIIFWHTIFSRMQ